MYKSRVTLTRDEEFAGTVTMSDTYLDCNGYEFRTSNAGNLEQWDHGTLYVDGWSCGGISTKDVMNGLQEALGIAVLMGFMKFFCGIIIQSACKHR